MTNTKNILAVFQLANAKDLTDGKNWYSDARQICVTLSHRYDISFYAAAGIVAALSPRNRWSRNIQDAENMIAAGKEAAAEIKVCTFAANKAKALKILALENATAEQVLKILSGPKLSEFFSCIAGINDEVCIDGHAYAIWAGERITLANVPSIGVKLRREIKAAYREAAKHANIAPHEMQAITWCAWRRLHKV